MLCMFKVVAYKPKLSEKVLSNPKTFDWYLSIYSLRDDN